MNNSYQGTTLSIVKNKNEDTYMFEIKDDLEITYFGRLETKKHAFDALLVLFGESRISVDMFYNMANSINKTDVLKALPRDIILLKGTVSDDEFQEALNKYAKETLKVYNNIIGMATILDICKNIEIFPAVFGYSDTNDGPAAMLFISEPKILKNHLSQAVLDVTVSREFHALDEGLFLVNVFYLDGHYNLIEQERLLDEVTKLGLPKYHVKFDHISLN